MLENNKPCKIAIDLTWIRHKKVGGTESFARNLIKGFIALGSGDFIYYLLVSMDNAASFTEYEDADNIEIILCNVYSSNKIKRTIWQNTKMHKLLKQNGIRICYEPIYSMPFIRNKDIHFVATIHDLQALHYPEYFTRFRVKFMIANWKNTLKKADYVITTSDYVKNDILSNFKATKDKIKRIYIPVRKAKKIEENKSTEILNKFGIEKDKFYFCLTSLLPHKNLETMLEMISRLMESNSKALYPIVISGVGGSGYDNLKEKIASMDIEQYVKITGFISDKERDCLYQNCRAFLFPSIFEGFGMPPVEALINGAVVITTKSTSIPEITSGYAEYVDDAKSADDWIRKLEHLSKSIEQSNKRLLESKYDLKLLASEYERIFEKI